MISMNDDIHRRRAGMTLLELVVALVVAGLALASGYQAYATISDRRLVAVTRSDQVTRAFNLRTMIANWLSNARLTVEEDDVIFRSIDDRKLRRPSSRGPCFPHIGTDTGERSRHDRTLVRRAR